MTWSRRRQSPGPTSDDRVSGDGAVVVDPAAMRLSIRWHSRRCERSVLQRLRPGRIPGVGCRRLQRSDHRLRGRSRRRRRTSHRRRHQNQPTSPPRPAPVRPEPPQRHSPGYRPTGTGPSPPWPRQARRVAPCRPSSVMEAATVRASGWRSDAASGPVQETVSSADMTIAPSTLDPVSGSETSGDVHREAYGSSPHQPRRPLGPHAGRAVERAG